MSDLIRIRKNSDGRAIITLYGKNFDVTENADAAGFGELKAFGDTYRFEIIENSVERAERIIKKSKK